jgi:YggT family protein
MPAVPEVVLTFLSLLLRILWLGILVRVILSWFPVDPSNPIIRIIWEITEPVLGPLRRVIPRIGMFDLSPLAAFLLISFLQNALPPTRFG